MKLFKKSDRPSQTCYIMCKKRKKRKEKESEIMNRKWIVESDEK